MFEESLSAITLSVDKQEEALLSPDSREEGEVESDGELTSESGEGKQEKDKEQQKVNKYILILNS